MWQPSGKRIHAHREGGGAEAGEGPGAPEGPEDKGPPKFDPDVSSFSFKREILMDFLYLGRRGGVCRTLTS